MSKRKLFTKSAFKQALFCPTSLYYYYGREDYANQNNEDDFLQALAEGGQQVGELAKVYYRITEDCDIKELAYDQALERTIELFKRESVNIAEAAFRFGDCFVRADIIEKKGTQINLVEVKAKSWDPTVNSFLRKKGKQIHRSIWEYVYDVAFQKYVIQRELGEKFTVNAYLMMVDKRKVARINGMNPMFKVINQNGRAIIERSSEVRVLPDLEWILTPFSVNDLCDMIIAGETEEQKVVMRGKTFNDFVNEMSRQYVAHSKVDSSLDSCCFKCPFYSNEKTPGMRDGRKECWKEKAGVKDEDFNRPSIGELWCGEAGPKNIKGELIRQSLFFLDELLPDHLPTSRARTKPGLLASERRLLQIALTTDNDEMLRPFRDHVNNCVYVDIPGLKREMSGWRYPLHMIDFETTSAPIPFYEGMRPYEAVAFQFSHHVIKEDGTIRHAGQYLNTKKLYFPNFEFVRELKQQLDGDDGTIFRYATHENSILRRIRQQLVGSQETDKEELIRFIDGITHSSHAENTDHVGSRDMVDLLQIVKSYYYHPAMKGSNSIKAVLPAILNSSLSIQQKYAEPIYGKKIESLNYTPEESFSWITYTPEGKVDNPYHHLKEIASFLGVTTHELEQFDAADADGEESGEYGEDRIANGGAALAAYTKLQFSDSRWTEALAKALLRYCELDTMSMVFIWEYFHEMTGI